MNTVVMLKKQFSELGRANFAAAVSVAVELGFGDPAFLEALEDVLEEVLIVWIAGTIISAQALFQFFSRCADLRLSIYIVKKGAL